MKISETNLDELSTPAEIRRYFIDRAKPIIDEYINAALGKSELQSTNSDARRETWDLMKSIISTANDEQKINAESTHDVICMLRDGRISIDEAIKLMNMLSIKSEIDDIRLLRQQVDQLVNGQFIDARPEKVVTPDDQEG